MREQEDFNKGKKSQCLYCHAAPLREPRFDSRAITIFWLPLFCFLGRQRCSSRFSHERPPLTMSLKAQISVPTFSLHFFHASHMSLPSHAPARARIRTRWPFAGSCCPTSILQSPK